MTNKRIIFMGVAGAFSTIPLQSLLSDSMDVTAVITPPVSGQSERLHIPAIQPTGLPTLAGLASTHGIPLLAPTRLTDSGFLSTLQDLRPDVVLVACYPQLLPGDLLRLPAAGCFNLHPSLLPRYRGPAPLFWQFYYGEQQTGISLHRLVSQVDAGEIVDQSGVAFPDGISGADAAVLLANRGSQLLRQLMMQLADGSLRTVAQDTDRASYHPWPVADDFRLSVDWPARRAFNFMRGTQSWGCPYPIEIGNKTYRLGTALVYSADEQLTSPPLHEGENLAIQFGHGVLRATVNPRA